MDVGNGVWISCSGSAPATTIYPDAESRDPNRVSGRPPSRRTRSPRSAARGGGAGSVLKGRGGMTVAQASKVPLCTYLSLTCPHIDSVTDPWHAHISPILHKVSSNIWWIIECTISLGMSGDRNATNGTEQQKTARQTLTSGGARGNPAKSRLRETAAHSDADFVDSTCFVFCTHW